jgi:glutamate---cysteine ligase / carboxylate-amine ligase
VNTENPRSPALRELPSVAKLRAIFDAAPAYTVGIEDEVMLLDPGSLELVPYAQQVLARLNDDQRFKLELPASQLEIVTPASADVSAVGRALLHGRRTLAARATGIVRLACAGAHPFSPGIGALNRVAPYQQTIEDYGSIAARQLVCALQVHVSVSGADRALALYNAARCYLPLLAALAANSPFYEGRDTGLASVRPKLAELLPRQGVPPEFESWERYAEAFRWGAAAGAFPEPRTWWWELRLHPSFGTLEFRVPDAQSTVADAVAIAAVTQALVAWLGERYDAGERLHVAPSWRIEENRWSACRYGVEGAMADLVSGERRPTRGCLEQLIETLSPTARRFGAGSALNHAGRLVDLNGAIAQRRVARSGGAHAVASWLAERFLESEDG